MSKIKFKASRVFKGEDVYPKRKDAFKAVFAYNVIYDGGAISTISNEETIMTLLQTAEEKIGKVIITKDLAPKDNTDSFFGTIEILDNAEDENSVQNLIPKAAWDALVADGNPNGYEDQKQYIPSGETAFIGDSYLKKVLYSLACGDNILLIGPMAAGKNTLIDYLAANVGRPEYELQCSSGAMEENFLGEYVLTMNEEIPNADEVNAQFAKIMSVLKGDASLKPDDVLSSGDFSVLAGALRSKSAIMEFKKGPLVTAMENGGWFVADEINFTNPSILGLCNSVLDNRRRINVPNYGLVEAKPGFRFFGTMNRGYLGTNSLNAATKSRFVSIPVDAPKSISGFLDCDDKAKSVLENIYQKMKTMDVDINIRAFVAVTKHLKYYL